MRSSVKLLYINMIEGGLMRLKITLKPKQVKEMNINYNYYLSSLCYRFLAKSNSNFASMLHEKGFAAAEKKFKLFTFSQLLCKRTQIEGSYIIFKDYVIWFVSSPLSEFILYFAQALLVEESFEIGGVEFETINVEVLKPKEITSNMIFKCLSPIAVNTGTIIEGEFKQYYLSVDDEKYKDNIRNNLIKKYFAFKNLLPKNMSLDIKILNLDECIRGKRINVKNSYIKGYMPIFQTNGSIELITMGYEAGYGSKNSMGCGMVEVINDQ